MPKIVTILSVSVKCKGAATFGQICTICEMGNLVKIVTTNSHCCLSVVERQYLVKSVPISGAIFRSGLDHHVPLSKSRNKEGIFWKFCVALR